MKDKIYKSTNNIIRIASIIEDGKLAGPQRRLIMTSLALKGRADIILFIPEENSKEFQTLCDKSNIPYIVVNLTRLTKELSVAVRYFFFFLFEVVKLYIHFKKRKYDIVYIGGGAWQIKGLIAAKLAGIKILWEMNDTYSPHFVKYLFLMLNRFSDGFVFASKKSQEYYTPLISVKKPKFVISSYVDINEFDMNKYYPNDEELIKSWTGKTVIGSVANVSPIKGFELLISAAADINKNLENCIFIVVGSVFNSQKKYYKKLLKFSAKYGVDNIQFVGGRDDIRALLKRFDIYVCTSYSESSSLSLREAVSMGKPVVSTDVGDVSLCVDNGKNGYIVDAGDYLGLSNKLKILIENLYRSKKFGEASREIALKELSVSTYIEDNMLAFETVLYGDR